MVHPDYIIAPEEADSLPLHEPVYRLTEDLPAKPLAKAIRGALEKVPEMPEWQDAEHSCRARGWHRSTRRLLAAHAPSKRGRPRTHDTGAHAARL